jgi:hypothetical protein
LWLSPIGFLGHFGRKSSETLDFPGKRRKRHAETTESSGKSGLEGVGHVPMSSCALNHPSCDPVHQPTQFVRDSHCPPAANWQKTF